MADDPNASAQVAQPGDVLCGKYRVERLIGQGGMGIVMEAWHLDFEERVAIKFLAPALLRNAEATARFEREARVLFKLKSPHVCRVLDVGKLDSGLPFMVMEFLEGADLAVRLADRTGMPVAEAVDYVVQACEAVGEAHARGVVHRDIKPENLFLAYSTAGEPSIKVLDFGLSKLAAPPPGERQRALTATEQSMGTPHYMSPEQWLSARDVGPASDQWSLAVILYELIAGVAPFEGEQLAQTCSLVLHAPMPSLCARCPAVPPALEQAIVRALAKDPQARFAHLGEFAAAIAPFGSPESVAAAEHLARMFDQSAALLASGELTPQGLLQKRLLTPAAGASPSARTSAPGLGAVVGSSRASASEANSTAPHGSSQVTGAARASASEADSTAPTLVSPALDATLPREVSSPLLASHAAGAPAVASPATSWPAPSAAQIQSQSQPGSRRAQTAQSWQQPMSGTLPPKRGGAIAAAVIGSLAAMAAAVGLLYPRLRHVSHPAASAATATASAAPSARATAAATITPATPTASATSIGSASPRHAPAGPPWWRTAPKHKPGQPPPWPPPPKPDLDYSHR